MGTEIPSAGSGSGWLTEGFFSKEKAAGTDLGNEQGSCCKTPRSGTPSESQKGCAFIRGLGYKSMFSGGSRLEEQQEFSLVPSPGMEVA